MKKKSHKNIYHENHENFGQEKSSKISKIKNSIINAVSGYVVLELHRLGKFPSNRIRTATLKYVFGMEIEKGVLIHSHFEIRHPWNISIGKGTVIGDYAYLDGRKGIEIGDNVNISSHASIWTMQHDVNDPYFRCNNKIGKVIIKNRVWISSNTTILPNTKIDEGAVIAAGGVVNKNCEKYSIYGGVPAKKISQRNFNLKYEFNPSDSIWFV